MQRCNKAREIYSRVCGYFRPVSNWNHGKREEFKDRKVFQPTERKSMGLYVPSEAPTAGILVLVCGLMVLLSGCSSLNTIAEGLTTKNVSGNGTLIDSHVGLNTDTKIPELRTMFISGDFATIKSGTNQVSYREESSASIWNASSITRKRFLSVTLTDKGSVPAAIKAVAEVFREASTPQAPAAESAPAETQPAPAAKSTPAQPVPAAK